MTRSVVVTTGPLVSTTMAPALTQPSAKAFMRAQQSESLDRSNGPTHQGSVMPGEGYEPLRTPFGNAGPAGAGRERNLTDLDLVANRHTDGYPFADANGRSTRQVPAMPRRAQGRVR